MNNVDKQYLDILRDVIENGTEKYTRAGLVKSVFGRMMRFNLKEGLPILTTKKMFTKGVIHELLWFLSGNTNIKYLVDNNIHIWDGDAYRYYCELVDKHNLIVSKETEHHLYDQQSIQKVEKDAFIDMVKNNAEQMIVVNEKAYLMSCLPNEFQIRYKFGDLGGVYGKQWRSFGCTKFDQIQDIINKLKTSPDDRRMLCVAFNQDALNSPQGVALPPCHTMFQFYTRELSLFERFEWFCEHFNCEYDSDKYCKDDFLDGNNVPKRALSLMWTQRSVDLFLGWGFNLVSYSILTYMIAQICNMIPDEVVCSLGDTHIYMEHMEAVIQQLQNDPNKYDLPKLSLNPNIKNIDDFTFDDIKIENYQSYPSIKAKLLVG